LNEIEHFSKVSACDMKKLFGNLTGLKASQVKRLEKIYQRFIPSEFIITPELGNYICALSHEINRQIGVLVNRKGKIDYVIVGNHREIFIPDLSEYRIARARLKGLKCIHTHFKDEPLAEDDLSDLALLRLDMMAAVTMNRDGGLHQVYCAHILPKRMQQKHFQILSPLNLSQLDIDCLGLIHAIEAELDQITSLHDATSGRERAILVSVTTAPKTSAIESLTELKDLTESAGIDVAGTVLQQIRKVSPRFLLGVGKLQDMTLMALTQAATVVIFDQELNPSQMHSIANRIELKVIDRTQLILDIFAQRAQTREGKLQVELAQLKYLLPRLSTKNTAMSRLTGGIGGRGPGETKLEINRRRVRDRIVRLEKSVSDVKKQRRQQKARRSKKGIPVIAIVGYTNAGKSTLLNTLTTSNVRAENRLFATLDPSSRRLKFPRDIEVIITDTVGFIKDLPSDLMAAFRATLEELESADLLLHVIDASSPRFENQIQSVETILADLDLHRIPAIQIFNKKDLLDQRTADAYGSTSDKIVISANDKLTLAPLIKKIEDTLIQAQGRWL
jgi:GTP-binding protein HflX